MRMPRRPFYPTALPPDIFGLQRLTLLGEVCETEAEKRKRVAKVEAGVVASFKAAVRHLGDEEARKLFASVLRRPKRGKGKIFAPDRDFRLLKEYDTAVRQGESVAALAKRLRIAGTELGNTEGAIAAQIRKLVKERKQEQRAAAVEARRWRMATRNERPSLLSSALAKK
jgi:hypothetical protein